MLRRPSENGITQAARRPLKFLLLILCLAEPSAIGPASTLSTSHCRKVQLDHDSKLLITTARRIVSTRLSISICPQF
jgi:hypothetical protein